MNRRTFLWAGALFGAFSLSPTLVFASEGQTSVALVETFHSALLSSMKSAAETGVKQRFKLLSPIVGESFHAGLMIQVASGSYWRKASETQHDALTAAFSKLSAATYAAQFDGYDGQSFETLGHKPGPQKTILVETQILNPGSGNVALTYVTRKIRGRWRIIDVLVDTGISELARKRSEYRGILKSGGVDGLVNLLDTKSRALLTD